MTFTEEELKKVSIDKKQYRTESEIIGAFGKWILRQYPYWDYQQDGLFFSAIKQIQKCLDNWEDKKMSVLATKDLTDFVRSIISVCSGIKEYNRSQSERNGGKKQGEYAFVSRYTTIKPEYDFIDLSALERNVVRELTEYENKDHDARLLERVEKEVIGEDQCAKPKEIGGGNK